MSTTSLAMHPTRAIPSSCTGEGPATPSPSTTTAECPLVAANCKSLFQTISTRRGVAPAMGRDCSGAHRAARRRVLPRRGLLLHSERRWLPLRAAAEQRREHKPSERHREQHVAEVMAVDAVRSVRLSGVVPRLAAGEQIRLRQFVEPVNEQLDDEDREKHGRHLEEEGEVDAMPEA